ncbi:EscU/YscU/HrcU family type III secretion system export apparatus switch protein [Halobacillus salinarum]|uniref:EscU/YscU/HrcU family type III secretion system export apparatus switch protein n=1 Tax=Halobacillus salinarum TaxID=2932257 RepID=A0ABY4EGP9_9BACI|nr:EscU/YscU/HrcU family type III secretion system export apparatus switch protein [Halobacillus salinarum]UOQ43068.1 EscU/YscU/HrcU family type III secretion system export apparatus switch protein [Halobacillus salinarum]
MTNQRKNAVALGYEANKEEAPRVIAKGKGYVAEKILENAQKHNIPVQEDPTLLELLSQLNINEQIPEELYHVVAEVFALIYRTDQDIE